VVTTLSLHDDLPICLKRWYPKSQTSEKNITEAKKSIIDEDEILLTEDTEYKELGFEDDEIEKDAEAIETEEEIASASFSISSSRSEEHTSELQSRFD